MYGLFKWCLWRDTMTCNRGSHPLERWWVGVFSIWFIILSPFLKTAPFFLGVKASLCLTCRLRVPPYTWQKHAEHNGDQVAGKSPKVRWRPNMCNLSESIATSVLNFAAIVKQKRSEVKTSIRLTIIYPWRSAGLILSSSYLTQLCQ